MLLWLYYQPLHAILDACSLESLDALVPPGSHPFFFLSYSRENSTPLPEQQLLLLLPFYTFSAPNF